MQCDVCKRERATKEADLSEFYRRTLCFVATEWEPVGLEARLDCHQRGYDRLHLQEQEVIKYLLEITNNQVGVGTHPITFLVASHAQFKRRAEEAQEKLKERAPKPPSLTREEIKYAQDKLPEYEKWMEQSAKETPTDPCYCQRQFLKSSWAAVTLPDGSYHHRERCEKDRYKHLRKENENVSQEHKPGGTS